MQTLHSYMMVHIYSVSLDADCCACSSTKEIDVRNKVIIYRIGFFFSFRSWWDWRRNVTTLFPCENRILQFFKISKYLIIDCFGYVFLKCIVCRLIEGIGVCSYYPVVKIKKKKKKLRTVKIQNEKIFIHMLFFPNAQLCCFMSIEVFVMV